MHTGRGTLRFSSVQIWWFGHFELVQVHTADFSKVCTRGFFFFQRQEKAARERESSQQRFLLDLMYVQRTGQMPPRAVEPNAGQNEEGGGA